MLPSVPPESSDRLQHRRSGPQLKGTELVISSPGADMGKVYRRGHLDAFSDVRFAAQSGKLCQDRSAWFLERVELQTTCLIQTSNIYNKGAADKDMTSSSVCITYQTHSYVFMRKYFVKRPFLSSRSSRMPHGSAVFTATSVPTPSRSGRHRTRDYIEAGVPPVPPYRARLLPPSPHRA